MGSACTKYDEWVYDPVHERPSAYVKDMKEKMKFSVKEKRAKHKKQIKIEDMTVDQLREYYDKQGRNLLDGMDDAGQ